MTLSEWPLRFIPRSPPPFWRGLAISLTAVALAVGARVGFLGIDRGLGLSVTYFPAFIVATLLAGSYWGWATLVAALAISLASPTTFAAGREAVILVVLFTLSGGASVGVAAAFRQSLFQVDRMQREGEATRRALAQAELRLSAAQEAGGVGLWDWDLVSRNGRWSAMVYRLLGLDPAQPATAEVMLTAIHPDDRHLLIDSHSRARETGVMLPVECRVVHPDGTVKWILLRGEVLCDATGAPVRAAGVSIDVSERRLAFQQMRDSEARFRTLADSAPVLMWVSRTDGVREFVNRAYVDFLGAPFDEALAFDWRTRLHPDDLDRVMREQIEGEASQAAFSLEARFLRHDGAYRWIRSVSQPRRGPTGDFAGFIGVGYDITDARQAQADLTRINDLLAERVEAALAERDVAEAALRRAQKLEAVGELTGGVAHDFNNLLTVIIGALDLMQRHPGDAARRERMIEAAMGAARRGERLNQQLLAFARRQTLKPQLVQIDALLTESEPLLRRAVGEAVNFSVAPGAPGAVASVDPSQFEAAVMNLVVNARDATPAGGAIRLESYCCTLVAGQTDDAPAGDYLCVGVHDTGSGMDAEVASRVFEPFFTTKEPGRGTGLGLSQVYGFARQSGGAAVIESEPGRGASVKIYLPLAEPVEAVEAAPASEMASEGPSQRVLLVEDDDNVGEMVEIMLGDLGHAVVRAASAPEALVILRGGEAVDLMLTDVIMPGGKTGVELAHEATALRPGLPIILSSGYTGDTLRAASDAPWPLLRKPYDAQALAQAIAEVISGIDAP